MNSLLNLKNKVAVITGGTQGIGLETAKLLAEYGARVVITSRSQSHLDEARKILPENVQMMQCDVSSMHDLESFFEQVSKVVGKIDILFANAGIGGKMKLSEVDEDFFDKMVSINYKGAYFTVQKSLSYLNQGASIILNASIAGVTAVSSNHSVYSGSKSALIQLARSFASELAPLDIRVNSISPGYIKTPIWKDLSVLEQVAKEVPLKQRYGEASEVASVVLFLASTMSSYITGQNLIIDGGVTSIIQHSTF